MPMLKLSQMPPRRGAPAQRHGGHAAEKQREREASTGYEVLLLRFGESHGDEANANDDGEIKGDDDIVDGRQNHSDSSAPDWMLCTRACRRHVVV